MSNKNQLTFLNEFKKIRFTKDKRQILFISDDGRAISVSSLYLLKMLMPALSLIENKPSN